MRIRLSDKFYKAFYANFSRKTEEDRIYPEFPDTFWSFRHALSFVSKKAAFPPLGLLTIASMLPKSWDKRLIDLNVRKLKDSDLEWADYAFISGMVVQKSAARAIIERCHAAQLKIVGGGPLFTMEQDEFADVDHLVLNEAELTLPPFLKDLANGTAKKIYDSDGFAEMKDAITPQWDLIDAKRYNSMAIQYSRGCPFNCDFCNITSLLGRKVRTKDSSQIIAELDALHAVGWRGKAFFVDDNFIGNKRKLKTDLLPKLIQWQKSKRGITFNTEASIDMADDEELMAMMSEAGFDMVFIGIETPEASSLAECSKRQNEGRDMVEDVKRIQRAGFQVQAGFIVGFDSDGPSVFRRQIEFIQRSGIATAMVGLLQAPLGTRLYRRMKEQGRILGSGTGDNVEGTTNIIPAMDMDKLYAGYKEILNHIYAPRNYYKRVKTFLKEYGTPKVSTLPSMTDIMAFVRSTVRLGVFGKERAQYWNLIGWTVFRRPSLFPVAVTLSITGYHFRRVCELHVQ